MLIVRILGGLQILTPAGAVDIPGEVQRRLLLGLVVSEGKVVSTESLIDEIWDDDPPAKAPNALQAHVSRLRRKLAAAEPKRRSSRLVSHPRGYRLDLDGARVDAAEFAQHVKTADALKESDPGAAATMLSSALAAWHGPGFGGNTGGRLSKAAAARYEEYRLRALESLFDFELSRGRHSHILGDLQEIHTENPFRERFCEQLMIALYRCGRQVDALEVYRRMWHLMIEELGIEASPRLRSIEHAILSHDRALCHEASAHPPVPEGAAGRSQPRRSRDAERSSAGPRADAARRGQPVSLARG
jgi:SARP family transcriptional regulator, regulator of embCAB operon